MAAPTKRPHLSFSVEAILSLSKRTRREKSDEEKKKSDEEKEETGNSCEELEKSVPDSTSQAIDSAIDVHPEEVLSEEKGMEENSPDSTSPEKDSQEEEIRPKPGMIRVEDVQVDQSDLKIISPFLLYTLIIWNTVILCELSLRGLRHSNALLALYVYAKLCTRNRSNANSTFLSQLKCI